MSPTHCMTELSVKIGGPSSSSLNCEFGFWLAAFCKHVFNTWQAQVIHFITVLFGTLKAATIVAAASVMNVTSAHFASEMLRSSNILNTKPRVATCSRQL
ncbi:hypothetical protein RvY_02903 [Ramazzottius varieornatus]|uniref:Uncharacterized protein n=1 Tax=Ramazzottius varieornatus TaxID=947166 RepID=A0A1D1UTB8_RAMVA|nr:hypothetical protein RvY_02903 [Ramazzottius varieornatus]